jgi:hypothetical protein
LRPLLDERIDIASQDNHRHIPAPHHGIIEQTQVKLASQLSAGFGSQAVDLAVPDLVTTRLARLGAVAINLAGYLFRT